MFFAALDAGHELADGFGLVALGRNSVMSFAGRVYRAVRGAFVWLIDDLGRLSPHQTGIGIVELARNTLWTTELS